MIMLKQYFRRKAQLAQKAAACPVFPAEVQAMYSRIAKEFEAKAEKCL